MDTERHEVVVEARGELGFLRFCSAEGFNGLTIESAQALRTGLEELARSAEIKVVVLAGNGRYFSTGGAMSLLSQLAAADVAERKVLLETVQKLVLAIRAAPALVYGQFEGLAAGAGVDLLMACDQIVASTSAKMNFSFAKLHLIPDLGGLFLLGQRVGHARAMNVYAKSETLDACAMRELGLLAEAPVASFDGYDWTRALRSVLGVSKDALVAAKQSLWSLSAPQFAAHLTFVNDAMSRLLDQDAHRQAVRRTRGMQKAIAASHEKTITDAAAERSNP